MSITIPKGEKKYSFAEYMAMEATSENKHDYYHGEIFAMAGGTVNHNSIIVNIAAALKNSKKAGCNVFVDGMKLEIEKDEFYVYPDLIYTCNEEVKGNELFVNKPSVIFEILSDTTALYDKEVKLKYYKKITSLKYYILVAQKEIMVEVYSRIDNSQIWQYQTFENLDETIVFDRLEFTLPLAVIYEGINFDAA
jgi:Uma2 family endonuclease